MLSVKLIIPDDVYQKIMWWINKSTHEVSGFGSLHFEPKEGVFTVRDAILLKQEVGPASTEIDPVALGKAMYEQRGQDNALKWHWHSHVDMGVFWSHDDKTLIENLGSQGWIVASVFNKKKEMKSAFFAMVDVGFGEIQTKHKLFLEDIPCGVQRYIDDSLCNEWDKEYDEHVKPIAIRPYHKSHWDDDYMWNAKEPSLKGFVDVSSRKGRGKAPAAGDHGHNFKYDTNGIRWSWKFDRWVYNPLYDGMLRDEEKIIQAIFTMDHHEVDSAYFYWDDKDDLFKKYYLKAKIIFEAEEAEAKRTGSVVYLPSGMNT